MDGQPWRSNRHSCRKSFLLSPQAHTLRLGGSVQEESESCADEENNVVRNLQLLTHKPLTYAANVGEGDLADRGQSNPQVLSNTADLAAHLSGFAA